MSTLILNNFIKKTSNSFSLCGSKSISQRALIINFLMGYHNQVVNLSDSDDTNILYKALYSNQKILNIKNSGTALRFLTSFFALKNKEVVLIGDEYLFQRPIDILIDTLNSLGSKIIKTNNSIIINNGSLVGGDVDFTSLKTSQFVSSLLLIAPYLSGGLRLHLPKKTYSKSYIKMTLSMLISSGIQVEYSDHVISVFEGDYQKPHIFIESDWTSASYLYLSFLFSELHQITINSFLKDSIQGDISVIDFFSVLGVKSEFHQKSLVLTKSKKNIIPDNIKWNFHDSPDLYPTIVIACLGLGVKLYATGVRNLQYKESNRIMSMKKELEKFNCIIDVLSDDTIQMNPEKFIIKDQTICIDTYNDHRIALSFSTLVLIGCSLKIKNSNVIKKSYPNFFTDLRKIGVIIAK